MKARLKTGGIVIGVLLILYWIVKHNQAAPAEKPTAENIGAAGVPYNPRVYWGPAGKPWTGYAGNENQYMPLFGFVGYSTYGTMG